MAAQRVAASGVPEAAAQDLITGEGNFAMWATSRATTDTAPPVARVRELNPGWFASVMGTAILAAATYDNPAAVEYLLPTAHLLGIVLAVLAYALAAVLLAAYLIR